MILKLSINRKYNSYRVSLEYFDKEMCQNKQVFTILSGGNIDANRYNELLGIDNG